MIGMENMRLQSRMDLSPEHLLTIYDHLHVCSQALRSTYIIYRYHCHVQQTGALGTKFIKMEEKHLCWKCQLIPRNWGKNLSPFFTVHNFNSITATEHPLHQLFMKNCEPVLWTVKRGLCNETWLIIDYVHTTILKLTTSAGLLETTPLIHYITHLQDGLFPFQLCRHQFLSDICNFYQKITKTNLVDHWCFHA